MLSFLDLFQTSVQRTSVATAANMCRGLSSENVDAVAAAVPILTNLLQYEVGHLLLKLNMGWLAIVKRNHTGSS